MVHSACLAKRGEFRGGVNREVQWWLANGSADRLLVVGTSPGLRWDERKRDWAADAPVPPALRGAFREEPLWVDLSDVSPTDRKSLLAADRIAAIAAPIRGVPKDTLIGEHLRQHRRTMRLAGSGITVPGVLTALAVTAGVIAVGQRDSAIRQRNQAIYREIISEALQATGANPSLAAQLDLEAYRMHPTAALTRACSARRTLRCPAR
jgi:hypothetical protein